MMARKKAAPAERREYGEGQITTIVEGAKYQIRASGGFDADGKRVRPARIVHGARPQARQALARLQRDLSEDEYIPPSDMSFGEWLQEWLKADARQKAEGTYDLYRRTIEKHIAPKPGPGSSPGLGRIPLQRLRSTHLRDYFNDKSEFLAISTLQQHYIIIHSALDAAIREGIIKDNPASRMMGKPRVNKHETPEDVLTNCWDEAEIPKFLVAAVADGPTWAALGHLALDIGPRKGEICGLMWPDIDWDASTVRIQRALKRAGRNPKFGPTKGRKARTVRITPETLMYLRILRRHQAEIRLALGPAYHDFNLVFAKEPSEKRRDTVGCPLQMNNIGQREFARIIKAAGIRPIKFHGLRHTMATQLLKRRVPVHYVSRRLGHEDELTTIRTYAHAIPSGENALIEDVRGFMGYTQSSPEAASDVPV